MDLQLVENNNGGDLVLKTKDLSVIYGFENMPYLNMFGGNVEESTPPRRKQAEQAFDFWGNTLLFAQDSKIQMNSETERTLKNTPITSFGLKIIEQSVQKDLESMRAFCKIGFSVSMTAVNQVTIAVKIIKPDNLNQSIYVFIWDATGKELTGNQMTTNTSDLSGFNILNQLFDFSF